MEHLDCIEMAGYIADMNTLRRKVHVEIVPSVMEAFGRVTVEAMLSGNPVLASDSGANPELIEEGKNGWLFKEGNVEDLAKKMKDILENQKKISQMGYLAYQEAKGKYLSDRNTKEVDQLYQVIRGENYS